MRWIKIKLKLTTDCSESVIWLTGSRYTHRHTHRARTVMDASSPIVPMRMCFSAASATMRNVKLATKSANKRMKRKTASHSIRTGTFFHLANPREPPQEKTLITIVLFWDNGIHSTVHHYWSRNKIEKWIAEWALNRNGAPAVADLEWFTRSKCTVIYRSACARVVALPFNTKDHIITAVSLWKQHGNGVFGGDSPLFPLAYLFGNLYVYSISAYTWSNWKKKAGIIRSMPRTHDSPSQRVCVCVWIGYVFILFFPLNSFALKI